MAKEKEKSWLSTISELIVPVVKNTLETSVKSFVHRGQDILYQTQKGLLERLIVALLAFCGTVIAMLSIGILLIQYLGISPGWAFFIVGLLLLCCSYLLNLHFTKTRRYNFEVKQ